MAGAARRHLHGAYLYEPPLLPYELASIARAKIRRDPSRRTRILQALEIALSIDTDMELVDVDHNAVVRLALTTGLTTYDASYLYLARTLGIPLVTFDRQLQAAADKVSN